MMCSVMTPPFCGYKPRLRICLDSKPGFFAVYDNFAPSTVNETFAGSGTQSNLIALMTHCQRGTPRPKVSPPL
jgi:hypothetical protein